MDWRLWIADRGAKVPSLWNRARRRHESGPMIGRGRWVECVIHPRQDKGIRKIKSETSSLGYLWHTSQLKEGIQKLKNQWWSTCWCRFFLILLLKWNWNLSCSRMNCYERTYQELSTKRIFVLLIWIMQYKTNKFINSTQVGNDYKSRKN